MNGIPEPEPPMDRSSPSLEEQVLNIFAGEDLVRTLHQMHAQSSGVVRLGLEAMELKVKGMTGQEIAALYGVKPNHVGAWISRAAQRLRSNRAFWSAFTSD